MKRYFVVLTVLALMLAGCGAGTNNGEDNSLTADSSETYTVEVVAPGPDDAPVTGSGYPVQVKNILFAHGYHDYLTTWDSFYTHILTTDEFSDWHVYRTDVDPKGSIENRGSQLADYISSLTDVEDDSMIVVGHSMGGLDLRYVISEGHKHEGEADNKYYISAKKIHKLYTLASPHGGDQAAGSIRKDDGAISLGITQMRAFNIAHPYTDSEIDGRKIAMLAIRFRCGDKKSSNGQGAIYPPMGDEDADGTVAVQRQLLFGAPLTQTIFHGRHTYKPPNECGTLNFETEAYDVLDDILRNTPLYTDVMDMVLYEGEDCTGDEKGAFSSSHKIGEVSCLVGNKCDNDEASSLKLYPGVKKNTTIKLYDSASGSLSDDWTRIHIGEEITEPYCVHNFQHNTNDDDSARGISVTWHYRNGLDGKVSAVKVFTSSVAADPADIVFYKNSNCTGDISGVFESGKTYDVNCKESDRCHNDQATSVQIFSSAEKSKDIFIFNDPDGDKDHAWAHINLSGSDFDRSVCISNFDSDTNLPSGVTLTSHPQDGVCVNCKLSGTVSHITIE